MSSAVCLLSTDCLLGQIIFRAAGHLENFPSCLGREHLRTGYVKKKKKYRVMSVATLNQVLRAEGEGPFEPCLYAA